MLPASWKPVPAAELVRLGPAGDGGYVVSRDAIAASNLLISMGLNHDWRFEQAFLSEQPSARLVCYDGSVDGWFWTRWVVRKLLRLRPDQALHYVAYRRFFGSDRAQHRRLMVGYDRPGSISLDAIMREFADDAILLKIDIEGSEYRILDQIVRHRDRLTAVVMELHDIDLHRGRIDAFLMQMTGFVVVHVTSNNFGGIDPVGDPIVIEISFVRQTYVVSPDAGGQAVAPAHYPHDPGRPMIEITFAD